MTPAGAAGVRRVGGDGAVYGLDIGATADAQAGAVERGLGAVDEIGDAIRCDALVQGVHFGAPSI